jgi:hypothetical protein
MPAMRTVKITARLNDVSAGQARRCARPHPRSHPQFLTRRGITFINVRMIENASNRGGINQSSGRLSSSLGNHQEN